MSDRAAAGLLARKAWRDLARMRGQVAAIVVVVALGVASLVALRDMMAHLTRGRDAFYVASGFADAWGRVVRAPRDVVDRIAALPGVAQAEGRVRAAALVRVPGVDEPAAGIVIGRPADGPRLDRPTLRRGRWPATARLDEALLGEAFADAHALAPGDSLSLVLDGRAVAVRVTGIVLSPEFVYTVGANGLFPDDRRNAVLWLDERALADALGATGSVNAVAYTLQPDADTAAVAAAAERLLAPFGHLGVQPREDQPSHRFLTDEIAQNRASSIIVPVLLLGVAAYLLNLTLGRLADLQREQFGLLRAFGVPRTMLLLHIAQLALVPAVIGALLGIVLGVWAADGLASVYAEYFRFPLAAYRPAPATLLLAPFVAVAAALVGAARALRRVARLDPATAMRPPAPPPMRRATIERLGAVRRLPVSALLVVRTLVRRPARTVGAVLALALAVAVGFTGRWTFDAIDLVTERVFRQAQREDLAVAFVDPVPRAVARGVGDRVGATHVEPLRSLGVRLRAGVHEERVAITGLMPAPRLRRALDRDGTAVTPPPDGVLLGRALAERLDVSVGDRLLVERLDGLPEPPPLRVGGIVDDLLGLSAWMDADVMARWLVEEPVATGVVLRLATRDTARVAAAASALAELPAVAGVQAREAVLRGFESTIARSLAITNAVFVVFSAAIAAGIVYNGARLALAERSRELSSLRVLGFTARETAGLLLGEQAILTAAALPAGVALGTVFCLLLARTVATDLVRLPLAISAFTVAWATGVVLVVSVVAGWRVAARVRRLDLVGVLKARE